MPTDRPGTGRRTGPRTAAGKAAVARNALRHGLAAAVAQDAAAASMAEKLATIGTGPSVGEAATQLAAAHLAWERVQDARARALARADSAAAATSCEQTLTSDAGAELTAALAELRQLERYARRTWSRRKKALRAFGRIVGEAVC